MRYVSQWNSFTGCFPYDEDKHLGTQEKGAHMSTSHALTQAAGYLRKDVTFIQAKKRAGQKISMLTCYDFPTARLEEQAGIDIIFVGDSVGTNVLGYDSEREVTMADMLGVFACATRSRIQRVSG